MIKRVNCLNRTFQQFNVSILQSFFTLGILAILDEACLNVGKVTDEMMLEAMDKKLKGHPHYTSRQVKPADKQLRHKVRMYL